MKISKLLPFALIGLSLFACKEHEIESLSSVSKSTVKLQNKYSSKESSSLSKSDDDLIKAIKKRYNADITRNGDGSYKIAYADSTVVNVTPTKDNHYIMQGTKMPGLIIDFYQTGNGSFDFEVLQDTNKYFVRPCSQHPKGESFNSCFKREWNEFCDGLVGCLAQATNPIPIAAAISLHCALC